MSTATGGARTRRLSALGVSAAMGLVGVAVGATLAVASLWATSSGPLPTSSEAVALVSSAFAVPVDAVSVQRSDYLFGSDHAEAWPFTLLGSDTHGPGRVDIDVPVATPTLYGEAADRLAARGFQVADPSSVHGALVASSPAERLVVSAYADRPGVTRVSLYRDTPAGAGWAALVGGSLGGLLAVMLHALGFWRYRRLPPARQSTVTGLCVSARAMLTPLSLATVYFLLSGDATGRGIGVPEVVWGAAVYFPFRLFTLLGAALLALVALVALVVPGSALHSPTPGPGRPDRPATPAPRPGPAPG